jgi:hypothetical protein
MTEKVCKYNSVPFLGNESNLGFRRLDADTGYKYVKNDLKSAPDIHPTELGHRVLAESLIPRISQLPLFECP